jgi:immune inhibitor A
MKKNSSILPIILVITLILCCCVTLVIVGAYYGFSNLRKISPTLIQNPVFLSNTPTPTFFQITRQPQSQVPQETLNLLESIIVPENDLTTLACQFKNVCNIPPTVPPPSQPYEVGAHQAFWVNNEDTNSYFQVQATLRYVTPHSYFWVGDNDRYNQQDIKNLMDAFENKIYPTDREFFGSEWTPGIDDDPHIYILYTSGLGANVGGYFYSPDEYPPQIRQYSNAHEMFYISSAEPLADAYTYGTLAHEFQHMIHWYQDPNETSFLNEGFSELATFLNHYDNGYFDQVYLSNTDLNLTDWGGSGSDNTAHYGASFLFVTYFLDRFGEDVTKSLIHNQQNGLDSIDGTFAQNGIKDPLTGQVIAADDFFLDWAVTNQILDGSVADGRYVYHNYSDAHQAAITESVSDCPSDLASRNVNQYGIDYILINCPGNYSLHFEGATTTKLLPADPHSGSYAYWSNKGDESDMTLSQEFDLGGVTGTVTMNYWTWYDIEKDYDYVFVEASTDGQHWTILKTPSGTSSNPNGASYGWGYTGASNGWIQESIDLSDYAGQKVYVRFEYLTDPAVNGEGFLLDDVSIPAINYSTDFETDDKSWQAAGFARIQNAIPQTFRLALITYNSKGTSVQIIPVTSDQTADIPLAIGQNGVKDAVLVVSGTTRFTRLLAPYQFSIR